MSKIFQVNTSVNIGSTGHIAEQINSMARKNGWETYFAYGRRYRPSESFAIRIGSKLGVIEHCIEHKLFDNDGLSSRNATRFLIDEIERIKPDIIHLHNIHDHWINYKILFEGINRLDIPVVWTQHDCWAFTGGCAHFSLAGCYQWRDSGCSKRCPNNEKGILCRLFEKTNYHYSLKNKLFNAIPNLTLVTVSRWLEDVARHSYLKEKNITTIYNGVDLTEFQRMCSSEVRNKYRIGGYKYVIGVSSVWEKYKGWNDYLELASIIPNDIKIVLVGLNSKQIDEAKEKGIIGIEHTESKQELSALYSGAEVVLNLSYQESFGLTTVEGLACGTPGIVYNNTASPELLSPETGFVVQPGSIDDVLKGIQTIISNDRNLYVKPCRSRVEEFFDKDKCFSKYIDLFNKIIANN